MQYLRQKEAGKGRKREAGGGRREAGVGGGRRSERREKGEAEGGRWKGLTLVLSHTTSA